MIKFDSALGNSLNGSQVDVTFLVPLDPVQVISPSTVTVVSPVGHQVTGILFNPVNNRLTFNVDPPFTLSEAIVNISPIMTASGGTVSGCLLVQVRNLAARKLDDGSPWPVVPVSFGEFEFIPLGTGLSEAADNVGFLSTLGSPDPDGLLTVDNGNDLNQMSTGIMVRKAGVGKQPYICAFLRMLDTNAVECVLVQRTSANDFSSQIIASLPFSTNAVDPAYSMSFRLVPAFHKLAVTIGGGGVGKSLPDIDLSEAPIFDETGMISFQQQPNSARAVRVRYGRLAIEDGRPPLSADRLANNRLRLSWSSPTYVPIQIEQIAPFPTFRILSNFVSGPAESFVEVSASSEASFFSLRQLKR